MGNILLWVLYVILVVVLLGVLLYIPSRVIRALRKYTSNKKES